MLNQYQNNPPHAFIQQNQPTKQNTIRSQISPIKSSGNINSPTNQTQRQQGIENKTESANQCQNPKATKQETNTKQWQKKYRDATVTDKRNPEGG